MHEPSGRAATVRFDDADPGSPEARQALASYVRELDLRFPGGFDPGDALTGHEPDAFRPPHGAFVVIRSGAAVVGCGALQRIDPQTGEIKRMWIDPTWRGLGLGSHLLTHLERRACDLGRSRVVLDTNATLTEAIALYERSGYVAIDAYNDNPVAERWFGKRLDRPARGS